MDDMTFVLAVAGASYVFAAAVGWAHHEDGLIVGILLTLGLLLLLLSGVVA